MRHTSQCESLERVVLLVLLVTEQLPPSLGNFHFISTVTTTTTKHCFLFQKFIPWMEATVRTHTLEPLYFFLLRIMLNSSHFLQRVYSAYLGINFCVFHPDNNPHIGTRLSLDTDTLKKFTKCPPQTMTTNSGLEFKVDHMISDNMSVLLTRKDTYSKFALDLKFRHCRSST